MKVNTFLPLFTGFYNSFYDAEVDSAEEFIIEEYNEANYTNLKYDDFNFTVDWVGYSKEICERIIEYIKEQKECLILGYEFQELITPKYYNFDTDSINIELDIDFTVLLSLMRENAEALAEKISERYTTQSGFISYHSPDIHDWFEDVENKTENMKHKVGAILEMLFEDEFVDYLEMDSVPGYEYVDYELASK